MPKTKLERGYPYQYYLIPDYSLSEDRINLLVQEEIANKNFNETIISRIYFNNEFPAILDIESEEGDQITTPTVKLNSLTPTL